MQDPFTTGDRYYYRTLPDHEKKIYDEIYRCLQYQRSGYSFPVKKHNGVYPTKERILELMLHVVWDNPQFFYFDATNMSYRYSTRLFSAQYQLMYTEYFTPAQILQIRRTLQMRAEQILKAVNAPTDYQKLCRLHDYLAKNVRYMDSIQRTDTLANLEARTILGPLLNHLGVCAGYTKTFKLLCNQMGIDCFYLRGQLLEQDTGWCNHGWNVVRLDGKLYHVDITTDSYLRRQAGINTYRYFLRSDRYMAKDHRWDRSRFPAIPEDYPIPYPR